MINHRQAIISALNTFERKRARPVMTTMNAQQHAAAVAEAAGKGKPKTEPPLGSVGLLKQTRDFAGGIQIALAQRGYAIVPLEPTSTMLQAAGTLDATKIWANMIAAWKYESDAMP